MPTFNNAKWIWPTSHAGRDEYAEFYFPFTYQGGKCELLISADSNYAVYLGGTLAAFGQYADFPHDKVYDLIDITEFCSKGENSLAVTVWYYGTDTTQVYCPGKAGLLLELFEDGRSVCASSVETLSRISRAYASHIEKRITGQLGYSFLYDASLEDGWMRGEAEGFGSSCAVDQSLPLRPRSCKRPLPEALVRAKPIRTLPSGDTLFDLGQNEVGLIYVKATAERAARLTVSYGEHIADGEVRRLVGGRDFSVDIVLAEGETAYTNPFRRLGCKYLQARVPEGVRIDEIGIIPVSYPLEKRTLPALTEAERRIYEACERTLRLCMHEHYEDCPWREQALYTMDSRNQMLCGYYAFGEHEFPRANLELIAADRREDGLLSVCYPMSADLVIPSFSLHFFPAVKEYLDHSGDLEFIERIYPKLESVISVFAGRSREGGLIPPFTRGGCYWNFYEWSRGLASEDDLNMIHTDNQNTETAEPDIALNALTVIALENMHYLSTKLGKSSNYADIASEIRASAREYFFDSGKGIFFDRKGERTYSVLGNALAILAGLARPEEAQSVAEAIVNYAALGLTPISLSMRCFLNDALLLVDREKYAPYILSEIERIYLPMVEAGPGTVYETELGESDFENAGSLCHGWSALPIYYYHILK